VTSPERSPEPVLRIDGVSKRFDATQALDDVSLELFPGEVHGIAGENGAGKSTLIKVMTGIHPADTGSMALAGEEFAPHSSAEAQRHGVAAIYQEPSIFPDLSVAENIFIGHEDQGWLVDFATMYAEAERLLTDLDIAVNPRLPASGLTVGGQQAVEIAKAISLDVRVLIMDEPTASLSAHEVERLFRQVRRLRQSGVAVVFITHRLEELFVIADRISVFRDGRRISTRPTSEVTEESLVREMVGRDPSDFFSRDHQAPGEVRLEVDSLGRDGVFSDISFDLRGGEVLGFAGLVGSGRTDIGLALFGVAPATEGSIRLDGRPVAIRSPRHALDLGIAYLSEDRRKLGLSMSQPVEANITLATLDRYTNGLGLLERAKERADADAMGKRLDIRAPSMATPVGLLSGGNQQKTMLAKWLNASPGVLILDEPTRGIDVGAKADVHRFIDELARSGIAIILISSDLPEVLAMSDRVAVLREGRLRAIYDRAEATEERVMTTAVGGQVG
jgi:rhamnose transport system ATP-binding protein